MKHEQNYQILINEKNQIILILSSKEGEPQSPCLLYDGRNHAVLYRTPTQPILLDYLSPEIHDTLKNSAFVVVLEENEKGDDISFDYKVPLKIVRSNPITGGLEP